MRKVIALSALAGILLLGGCAGAPATTDGTNEGTHPGDSRETESTNVEWIDLGDDVYEVRVTLTDGRKKVCIVIGAVGGTDCFPTAEEEVVEE